MSKGLCFSCDKRYQHTRRVAIRAKGYIVYLEREGMVENSHTPTREGMKKKGKGKETNNLKIMFGGKEIHNYPPPH